MPRRNELLEVLAPRIGAAVPVLMVRRDKLLEVLAPGIGATKPMLMPRRNELLKVSASGIGTPEPVLVIGRDFFHEVAAAGVVANHRVPPTIALLPTQISYRRAAATGTAFAVAVSTRSCLPPISLRTLTAARLGQILDSSN